MTLAQASKEALGHVKITVELRPVHSELQYRQKDNFSTEQMIKI